MSEGLQLLPIRKVAHLYTCPRCREYLSEVDPDPNTIDAIDKLYRCLSCKSKVAIKEVTQTTTDQEPRTMIFYCYFGRPEDWEDGFYTDTCRTGDHGDPPFKIGDKVKPTKPPIFAGGTGASEALHETGVQIVTEVVHQHRGGIWGMRLRSEETGSVHQAQFFPCYCFELV